MAAEIQVKMKIIITADTHNLCLFSLFGPETDGEVTMVTMLGWGGSATKRQRQLAFNKKPASCKRSRKKDRLNR